jgi:serine/threonine-protein kinase
MCAMAKIDDLTDAQRAHVATLLTAVSAGTLSLSEAMDGLQAPPPNTGLMPSDRYVDLGVAGRGGMAEVRRVHDQLLDRVVAMKFMHWHLVDAASARRRFVNEAQITAGLAHPGIVAVHDRGLVAGVRPWFTMKFVEGVTLAEAAKTRALRRLIEAFARVCEAMAHAHAQGVVHRDLKPQNVMIGAFGEVLVLDWGLARRIDAAPLATDDTHVNEAGHTRLGDIMGTPAFMSPEQAGGQAAHLGPRSDVYALGAILYALLMGQPPYQGSAHDVMAQVRTQPPPVPVKGPPELCAVCERAMQHEAADRYGHADALREAIRAWLDGDARRNRALSWVERAQAARPRGDALRRQAEALATQAAQALEGVPPYAPIEQKRAGWALEDQAAALRRKARISDAEALRALRAALADAPDLVEANALLTQTYRTALLDAEARRDADAAEEWAWLLRAHDADGNAAWLQGDGQVTLHTQPAGAQVRIERYTLVDRRLVAAPLDQALPPTPWNAHPLPMGSYLLHIETPGCAPVRYPVVITRQAHWDGRPPETEHPTPIPLPQTMDPDEVYVPAGWFRCGGDPQAPDGLSERRIWVDGFIIERHPVTNARYLAYLNDLVAQGRADEARARAPWDPSREQIAYAIDADGRYTLGTVHGVSWQAQAPVAMVSWTSAMAFAAWQSARDGKPWRLPHSLEIEKATRGVDGRRFPWGDAFDHTWARAMNHSADPPAMAEVDATPTDVSVYGVYGLAGNVRDLCIDGYVREGAVADGARLVVESGAADLPFRMVKGGSFNSEANYCRAATRFALRPDFGIIGVGFRLCRPYGTGD